MIETDNSDSSALHLELSLRQLSEEQQLYDKLFKSESHGWTEQQTLMVDGAWRLAAQVHAPDTYQDKPYTFHLLRNAIRATYGLEVRDPEMIAAIMLHDSIEDHPKSVTRRLSGVKDDDYLALHGANQPGNLHPSQILALSLVAEKFTPRVAQTIAAVTNEPRPVDDYDEWIDKYVEKVKSAVGTFDGWVVKFVDWVDNAFSIEANDDPALSDHYKYKYGKVLALYEESLHRPNIYERLSPEAKDYAQTMSAEAKKFLFAGK